MAATVTIACKHPPGIFMQVYKTMEKAEAVLGQPGVSRMEAKACADGAPIKINGPVVPFGQAPAFVIAGGYALTSNVPADYAAKWMEQNRDSALVRNSLIYIKEKADDAAAKAKEYREIKSGMERLDVGTITKGGREIPKDSRWPARINRNLSGVASDLKDDAA